ncbi:MAG: FAD-dependent oxidoreductase, partial [Chloroflexi bacterium]|nr:FAD-dependent oxidoreductase [Chloroflexota bacterium]
PVAGREGEWADLVPAASSKRVLVIGGGPAGMEVARVAAERGHNVTLLERSGRLGGQVNIAASAPGRSEFGEIARYLEGQLRRLKVDVRLNTEATLDLVAREAADAVVIATGSTPHLPQIPGAEGGNVLTARQVLETDVAVGERVVVVDTQGLMQGCDVANYLSKQGKDVEIVTGMPYVGENIQAGVWRHLYEELLRQGVTMSPLTGVSAIGESTVSTFSAVYAEARRVIEGVDTVVFASGGEADDQLFRALQGSVADLHAIGDCVQPRTVEAAVYEGHKLGRLL